MNGLRTAGDERVKTSITYEADWKVKKEMPTGRNGDTSAISARRPSQSSESRRLSRKKPVYL